MAATASVVTIETSMGTIKAELWPDKAPATVSNFLAYVDEQFYDGLVFHRVINRFMIQGGGFASDMRYKRPTRAPVKNEARSDAPNKRGTLAMARTAVVDSATSQFFINHVDNAALNHRSKSDEEFGYCVFGNVTEGLDVLDAIAKVPTGVAAGHRDVPVEPVVIKSIRRSAP
jgi:peptidyl-prolyl cis-trans isomerase B (cyclophilin B)